MYSREVGHNRQISSDRTKIVDTSKVKIFDQTSNQFEGDILLHDTNMDNGKADNVKINLVPEEGFVEDINPDRSKKFTCKQCGKTCKTKQSVKQHIANTHKKQAMKRTAPAGNSENVGRK